MKNKRPLYVTLSVLSLTLGWGASVAWAAPKSTSKPRTSTVTAPTASSTGEPTFRETTPAPIHHSSSAPDFSKTVSLGLTSLGNGGISGMLDLGSRQNLQAYAGIQGVSGAFQFTVGGIYRMGIFGTRANGFHIGGGVELGTTLGTTTTNTTTTVAGIDVTVPTTTTGAVFFAKFLPLAGIHFSLSGVEALTFSVDAGPQLSIVDGNADFSMGPLSGLLGASVHYAVF